MNWGMISAVTAVVALVPTVAALFIAWRSMRNDAKRAKSERDEAKSERDEAERARKEAEKARKEAERRAARLAIVSLVRRLDEHNLLTPEVDEAGNFYGTPGRMDVAARSIREELLKVEHALQKAQNELDDGYEEDIETLQVMAKSCSQFIAVLDALQRRKDLADGGDEFYREIHVPHGEFSSLILYETVQLARRHDIQRRSFD